MSQQLRTPPRGAMLATLPIIIVLDCLFAAANFVAADVGGMSGALSDWLQAQGALCLLGAIRYACRFGRVLVNDERAGQ